MITSDWLSCTRLIMILSKIIPRIPRISSGLIFWKSLRKISFSKIGGSVSSESGSIFSFTQWSVNITLLKMMAYLSIANSRSSTIQCLLSPYWESFNILMNSTILNYRVHSLAREGSPFTGGEKPRLIILLATLISHANHSSKSFIWLSFSACPNKPSIKELTEQIVKAFT